MNLIATSPSLLMQNHNVMVGGASYPTNWSPGTCLPKDSLYQLFDSFANSTLADCGKKTLNGISYFLFDNYTPFAVIQNTFANTISISIGGNCMEPDLALKLVSFMGFDLDNLPRGHDNHLFRAVIGKNIDLVQALVDAGVNLNRAVNSVGETALHLAVDDGSERIAKILIEGGADLNIKDELGMTPLHYAATESSVRIVQDLIKAGADLNVQDNAGNTPLYYAELYKNPDMIKAFVDAKTNLAIKDVSGKTSLILAEEQRDNETVEASKRLEAASKEAVSTNMLHVLAGALMTGVLAAAGLFYSPSTKSKDADEAKVDLPIKA